MTLRECVYKNIVYYNIAYNIFLGINTQFVHIYSIIIILIVILLFLYHQEFRGCSRCFS